ncbi:MAG: HAMP domain-containing sensor histidine kinase [Caldimonas sp.]
MYRRIVRPHGGVPALYAFLILDPCFLVGVLVQDPVRFAFLHPFLLVVVVRTGIRFGIRTMYLSLAATLLASTALLASSYWRENPELAQAFLLMLAFVPIFFSPLIRRIHKVRAIEAERARANAVHELAVARNLFLARVSHELRSPLQSIVSALDVIEMRQRQMNLDDQELLGGMRRSSLLLNAQLRDLLTLTKGEAGRLQMRPEPFDAVELITATMGSLADLARAKELLLVADVPPGPLFVVADAARIDQVLTNLIVNSIRYTEAGHVRVSMCITHLPAAALRFLVADTGPGIAQEALPMLFEPDRVLTSAVRRGEGSGIGLAIVRTLVEHLGGKISVASTADEGTTFTVDIPVVLIDAEASRGVAEKGPAYDEPDELRETRD